MVILQLALMEIEHRKVAFSFAVLLIAVAVGLENGPIRTGLRNFFDQLGAMIGEL